MGFFYLLYGPWILVAMSRFPCADKVPFAVVDMLLLCPDYAICAQE